MDGLLLLVAGLFLDSAAALTLLVPIPKFSRILGLISTLQLAVMRENDANQTSDVTFALQGDHNELEKMGVELSRYEKHLFPYGVVFLVVGFVVAGVMIGS